MGRLSVVGCAEGGVSEQGGRPTTCTDASPLSRPKALNLPKWQVRTPRILCLHDDVGVALGLTAAKEGIAFFRFASVAAGILNLAGNDGLLAGGAVPHAAAVVEIEIVRFTELENTFLVARPGSGDAGFLEYDVSHAWETIQPGRECKPFVGSFAEHGWVPHSFPLLATQRNKYFDRYLPTKELKIERAEVR